MAASPLEFGNLKFCVPGKPSFTLNMDVISLVPKNLNPFFHAAKIQLHI
jgi:hypothetical protein